MPSEDTYVAALALRWAATDPLEQWVQAAPTGGPEPIEETIREYLGNNNPFPDGMAVDVEVRGGQGWEPAVIVDRVGADEWTVQYEDGEQGWRDHSELRPARKPEHQLKALTVDEIAERAPIALTYPGSDVVNVRMQTEHLYVLERDLAAAGVTPESVAKRFEDLHRLPPTPLATWLAAVTDAYNATVAAQGVG